MGKILIIKGADFSSVAVEKVPVSLPDDTPPVEPTSQPVITISSSGSVTISCSGATNIYFTTDGSIPTTSSTKYTSAFTVSNGTTVKAIAEFRSGTTSSVVSKTYSSSETDAEKVASEIATAIFMPGRSMTCSNTGLFPTVKSDRGTVLIPKSSALFNTPWTHTSGVSPDFNDVLIATDVIKNYCLIALPKGAKKVTLKMTNTDYYYGLCVYGSDSKFIYDSGWRLGSSSPLEKDLTEYENEQLWIASTFRNSSSAIATVPNITLQELGWSAIVEY